MSATLEEYLEVLNAEVYVDVGKLQFYARHGIPTEIRGETWLYLLGVLAGNKSNEMSSVREKYMAYKNLDKADKSPTGEMSRRVRGEIGRGHKRLLYCLKSTYSPVLNGTGKSVSSGSYCTYSPPVRETTRSPNGMAPLPSPYMSKATSEGAQANGKMLQPSTQPSLSAPDHRTGSSLTSPVPIYAAATSPSVHARSDSTSDIHVMSDTETPHQEFPHDALQLPSATLSASPSYSEPGTALSTSSGTTFASSVSATSNNRYMSTSWANVSDVHLLTKTVEHVVLAYINAQSCHQVDSSDLDGERQYQDFYQSALVRLCLPFVVTMRIEAEIYFSMERWLDHINGHMSPETLSARAVRFNSAFRALLPDLYGYFEEEEVDLAELASSWLVHYFAREMRMDNLLRLWDTYLATASLCAGVEKGGSTASVVQAPTSRPDGQSALSVDELHLYVCLAVLTKCKDDLEELEQSEIRSMLFRLPHLDIDRILNEAMNIQLILQKLD